MKTGYRMSMTIMLRRRENTRFARDKAPRRCLLGMCGQLLQFDDYFCSKGSHRPGRRKPEQIARKYCLFNNHIVSFS